MRRNKGTREGCCHLQEIKGLAERYIYNLTHFYMNLYHKLNVIFSILEHETLNKNYVKSLSLN